MNIAAITFAMVASLAPPAAFDHKPTEVYTVTTMPHSKIVKVCGDARALGCNLEGTGFVFVTEGLRPKVRDLILRHEFAHVNGWDHNHGNH